MNQAFLNLIKNDLEGHDLASVVFVRGYIQLTFDGPIMSIYVPFDVISCAGECARSDELHFKNLLCSFISKNVESVYLDNDNLILQFKGGGNIKLNLKSRETEDDILYYINERGEWG